MRLLRLIDLGTLLRAMTFDLYGHLFPNEKDDLERLAAGELALIGPAKAPG
jgi:hypothetical protein